MSPTMIAAHLTPYLRDLRESALAERAAIRALPTGKLVVSDDGRDAKEACSPIEMALRIARALDRRCRTRRAKELRAWIKINRAALEGVAT